MGIMFLGMFAGTLLSLAGVVPLPVAMARFAAHGKLGEAFRLRRLLKLMRANGLDYVIAGLLALGLISVLYLALMLVYYSVVLCCLLPLLAAPTGFYLQLVLAALYGKVYRDSAAATA